VPHTFQLPLIAGKYSQHYNHGTDLHPMHRESHSDAQPFFQETEESGKPYILMADRSMAY
jgi:hypothetical protein